jgi:hypothetical protein
MECFKADVTTLSFNDAAGAAKPNKESTEYAIVALIRTFSAEADTFRSYLQAGADARATAAQTGLKVLSQQVRGLGGMHSLIRVRLGGCVVEGLLRMRAQQQHRPASKC